MLRLAAVVVIATLSLACARDRAGRPDAPESPRELRQAALDPELGGWAEEFAGARLRIRSPTWNQVVPPGPVEVVLDLEGYHVEPDGPHVHFIVDNEPYRAIFDTSRPVVVENLAPGAHVIRVFPSRPWHESVKSAREGFDLVRFVVGEDDGAFRVDREAPLLTYSRPRGAYSAAEARRMLFDFYVSNTELSEDGHRVAWKLNDGEQQIETEWQAIWWEGLPPGEHTVEIDLVNPDGSAVANGGLNFTKRTFVVRP